MKRVNNIMETKHRKTPLKLLPEWVNSAQAFEIVSLRLVVTSK